MDLRFKETESYDLLMMETRRGKENSVDNWLYRIELFQREKIKRRKSYHLKGSERVKNGSKYYG